MKKAVFLDRDGVINKEMGDYVYAIADFHINDGIIDALKLLKDNNYLLFVITNQGGIARGIARGDTLCIVSSRLLPPPG